MVGVGPRFSVDRSDVPAHVSHGCRMQLQEQRQGSLEGKKGAPGVKRWGSIGECSRFQHPGSITIQQYYFYDENCAVVERIQRRERVYQRSSVFQQR